MSVQRARECAEECVAISEELHNPNMLFNANVLLARIEAAEGRVPVAVEQLGVLLSDAGDDEQRAELEYWLWTLTPAVPSLDTDHRVAALRLYESLFAKTPKHDYRKRIEELEHTPDSSL